MCVCAHERMSVWCVKIKGLLSDIQYHVSMCSISTKSYVEHDQIIILTLGIVLESLISISIL